MTYSVSKQKISKNFYLYEFVCKCEKCRFSSLDINPMDLVELPFIQRLQRIRDDFGLPMAINSGARCREHNEAIGGAFKSPHLVDDNLLCTAADVSTVGYTPAEKHLLVSLVFKHGMRGFGLANTYIHMDLKKRKGVWSY